MIYTNFTWKGQPIPSNYEDTVQYGWIGKVDINGLVADSTEYKIEGYHGVKSTLTFARARIITIKGRLYNYNAEARCLSSSSIGDLFNPVDIKCDTNEFYDLTFDDYCGNTWVLKAKVKSFVSMPLSDDCEPVLDFTVQLLAESPVILSSESTEASLTFGRLGGIALSDELPEQFNQLTEFITAENQGTYPSPTLFTFTGPCKNPRAYVDNRYFGVFVTLGSTDTLVIDSINQKVELNGVNILGQRMDGSTWLNLKPNVVSEVGVVCDFPEEAEANGATASVEYYNAIV